MDALQQARAELFQLEMQLASNQLNSVHLIKQKRREIARLLTQMNKDAQ